MPVGTVKWFDADRGFGFASNPSAEDVFVSKQVLPAGVQELQQGQRIEFDFASGRKGPQALRVKILDSPRQTTPRKPQHKYQAEELHGMISDVVSVLESTVQPGLRAGHYPDHKTGHQVAQILRAIAAELDARP